MIITGFVLFIFGAILYCYGVEINNNMDARLESLLNDGVTDPGSTYETIGIFLLIAGVLLIIVGVIFKVIERRNDYSLPQNKYTEIDCSKPKNICVYCGSVIYEKNYCTVCGKENSNYINCPNCNQRIPCESTFCEICGAEIVLYKFSLQNASVEEVISSAFDCLKSGDFRNATLLLDFANKKAPKDPTISLGKLLAAYRLHTIDELANVEKDFGINIHFRDIMSSDDETLKNQLNLYYMYSQACISMEKMDYSRALELFEKTGDLKDSNKKMQYCQYKLNRNKNNE